ncbi:MAG: 4-hydroxythreonine-4-phosphate dehydrogenase PdxA [Planctomycetota bacterium]
MASAENKPPRKPVIGITMGDPAGVGAEVVVKALADAKLRRRARFVVFGLNEQLTYAADLAEIEPYWHRLQHDAARATYALVHDVVVLDYDEENSLGAWDDPRPSRQHGIASLRFLDDAAAAAQRSIDQNGIDALVTAPIAKASWHLAGCNFPGHTEFLQHRTKAKRAAMMFVGTEPDGRPIRTVLATIHLALMDLRNTLTIGTVHDAIDLGHQALLDLGVKQPRIGVAGLNPHASENGAFGDEERRLIEPAIQLAQKHGIDARGPFPADTLYTPVNRKRFDLTVAMYHDQGLIPLKALAFDNAVNLTLGLPIIRTSPDHGTAFDIAGKNRADPRSMIQAINLAITQAEHRIAHAATSVA